MRGRRASFFLGGTVVFSLLALPLPNANAQVPSEFPATTEQACSFGMAKGEPSHACQVPFPPAALSPMRPARTNPGRPFPKGARPSAALTRSTPIGKPRSPGPAAAAALPSAPSSSLSGLTAIPTEFGWAQPPAQLRGDDLRISTRHVSCRNHQTRGSVAGLRCRGHCGGQPTNR